MRSGATPPQGGFTENAHNGLVSRTRARRRNCYARVVKPTAGPCRVFHEGTVFLFSTTTLTPLGGTIRLRVLSYRQHQTSSPGAKEPLRNAALEHGQR